MKKRNEEWSVIMKDLLTSHKLGYLMTSGKYHTCEGSSYYGKRTKHLENHLIPANNGDTFPGELRPWWYAKGKRRCIWNC